MTSNGVITYPTGNPKTFIYTSDETTKWQSFIANLNAAQASVGFKLVAGFGVIISKTEAYIYVNSITGEKLLKKDKGKDVNNNITLKISDSLNWFSVADRKETGNTQSIVIEPGNSFVALVQGVFEFNDLN